MENELNEQLNNENTVDNVVDVEQVVDSNKPNKDENTSIWVE